MDKAVLAGQGERSDAHPASAPAATAAADPAVVVAAADPAVVTDTADLTAVTVAVHPPVVTGTADPPVVTGTADPPVVTGTADPAVITAAAESAAVPAAPPIPDGSGGVSVSPDAAAAEVRARARAPRWANLPYAIVLAATAGGLSWVAMGGLRHVQAGMITVASALLVAAMVRLVLPERAAGLLASRSRVLDVLALASLGTCIMAAVLVLPSP